MFRSVVSSTTLVLEPDSVSLGFPDDGLSVLTATMDREEPDGISTDLASVSDSKPVSFRGFRLIWSGRVSAVDSGIDHELGLTSSISGWSQVSKDLVTSPASVPDKLTSMAASNS